MTSANTEVAHQQNEIIRVFSGTRQMAHAPLETVESAQSQAALRQFTLERLMGYGVHFANA